MPVVVQGNLGQVRGPLIRVGKALHVFAFERGAVDVGLGGEIQHDGHGEFDRPFGFHLESETQSGAVVVARQGLAFFVEGTVLGQHQVL